jgi:acetylornithine deacetylase/succinyl-diaminopimelate desuccinylase-like protein
MNIFKNPRIFYSFSHSDILPLALLVIFLIFLQNQSAQAQALPVSFSDDTQSRVNLVPPSARMLSQYLQFNSVTGNEAEAGKFLAGECRDGGLNVRVFSDRQDEYNFAASLYPLELGLPNIILLNHIDVVPAGNPEAWDFDPFSGKIHNGMIYGRGAIDMKSMAIMQFMALRKFAENHRKDALQFNVTLLSVSGEEDFGTKGAGWVVDHFFEELNPMVVYNEGGSGVYGIFEKEPEKPVMCVSIAEKKALWVELVVKDPSSGHGSVPPMMYSNKIALMELNRILGKKPKIILDDYNLASLKELGRIEGGIRGFVLKNARFFKPLIAAKLRKDPLVLSTLTNTITLTQIGNPSGATNQIAQETVAELDCRLLPGYSTQDFLNNLNKKIRHKNTTIRVINQSQEAPASPMNDHYRRLADALKNEYPDSEVVPVLFPAVTDNNQFRKHGVPTYGINPVCLSKDLLKTIHNINERIPVTAIDHGASVYYHLLESINGEVTDLLTHKQVKDPGRENGR